MDVFLVGIIAIPLWSIAFKLDDILNELKKK